MSAPVKRCRPDDSFRPSGCGRGGAGCAGCLREPPRSAPRRAGDADPFDAQRLDCGRVDLDQRGAALGRESREPLGDHRRVRRGVFLREQHELLAAARGRPRDVPQGQACERGRRDTPRGLLPDGVQHSARESLRAPSA